MNMTRAILAMVLLLCVGSASAQFTPIDEVQEYDPSDGTPISKWLGKTVSIQGNIFVLEGTYDAGTYYIHDTDAGVKFYQPSATYLALGDLATAIGEVGILDGEIYIKVPAVTREYSGSITPSTVAIDSLVDPYDYEQVGSFIRCTGEVAEVVTEDIWVHNQAGDTVRVNIDPDTGIIFSHISVGDSVSITAAVSKEFAEILLRPRVQNDLVKLSPSTIIVVQPDGLGDYPTIQDAVNAAGMFEIIELTDGIFKGGGNRDIDMLDKGLVIRSQNQNPTMCIIDCEGSDVDQHRGFYYHGDYDHYSVLSGITVSNGYHGGGAALYMEPYSPEASSGIGPDITNCIFEANTSTGGGGAIYAGSGGYAVYYYFSMTDCLLEDNQAEYGGVLACNSSTNFLISDCTFSRNRANSSGIISYGQFQDGEFTRCVFDSNTATAGGGVTSYSFESWVTYDNCIFTRNSAPHGGVLSFSFPASQVGGQRTERQVMDSFNNCIFSENNATNGGVLKLGFYAYPSFNNCQFRENSATYGGAVHVSGENAGTWFQNSLFVGNSAEYGGAFYQVDNLASPEYLNVPVIDACTFVENAATTGGTFYCESLTSTSLITNCIVAFGAEGGAFHIASVDSIGLGCCDIYGNAGGDYSGVLAGYLGIDGNISADPLFCDQESGEYTLLLGSPCLPAGKGKSRDCGLIGVYGEGCTAAAPIINCILDVGNDQGRQVRIDWNRSIYDALGSAVTVTGYSLYRREDQHKSGSALDDIRDQNPIPISSRLDNWDYLATIPARGDSNYQYVASTLCDSTITDGMCWSAFMISTVTTNPLVYFDSPPDSGYSVDNIAPAVPGGFRFESPGILAWDESVDVDFMYFSVFGSEHQQFDESAKLLGNTIETGLDVTGEDYPYFHLATTDYAGNQGDESTISLLSGVHDGFPDRCALHQCVPNPFNPLTTIRYDLPESATVDLRVYDISGRLVIVLVGDNETAPGRHEITWNGQDRYGQLVAAGVYFYRLEAGSFGETKRMTLVK